MKGLILCAGKGSRLHPFSESISKVLLPVANKPTLYYCIDKLLELKIKEVGIVIRQEQFPLFMKEVGTGEKWNIHITYIYQDQPLGISNAVKHAESFIQNDSFILLLGDNLIAESLENLYEAFLDDQYNAAILLGRVATPQDFGIAEVSDNRIIGLEEKPAFPKTNLAMLGAYAFRADIFKAIHAISPSARGEYEITDAIQWMINQGYSVAFRITEQNYSDVGTMERWLEANRWMLDQLTAEGLIDEDRVFDGCQIIPPVLIDSSCELINCVIGPYVTIGKDVKLEGCHYENSILLEGLHVTKTNHKMKNTIQSPQSVYIQTSRGETK